MCDIRIRSGSLFKLSDETVIWYASLMVVNDHGIGMNKQNGIHTGKLIDVMMGISGIANLIE